MRPPAGIPRLPRPATHTRQSILVDADVPTTLAAVHRADLSTIPALVLLTRLRLAPDRFRRWVQALPPAPAIDRPTIDGVVGSGFWVVLDEIPQHGLWLGLTMWNGGDDASHRSFEAPGAGSVRVVWSFTVEPAGAGRSHLVTETGTYPTDAAARRKLSLYWTVIAPFAAMARRLVLRAIAASAEVQRAAVVPDSPVVAK